MRSFLTGVAIVVLIFVVGSYFNRNYDKVEPVVATPNEAGMCFKEFLPYGEQMSWSQTSEGHYDYQIYANTHGIEVWVPCK